MLVIVAEQMGLTRPFVLIHVLCVARRSTAEQTRWWGILRSCEGDKNKAGLTDAFAAEDMAATSDNTV